MVMFLSLQPIALTPTDRGTNSLIWKQIATGRRGVLFPQTGEFTLLINATQHKALGIYGD